MVHTPIISHDSCEQVQESRVESFVESRRQARQAEVCRSLLVVNIRSCLVGHGNPSKQHLKVAYLKQFYLLVSLEWYMKGATFSLHEYDTIV